LSDRHHAPLLFKETIRWNVSQSYQDVQFGQGVIRCHPYAYGQLKALEKGDIDTFDTLFFSHVRHVLGNGFRSLVLGLSKGYLHYPSQGGGTGRYEQKLAWASARFAFWSDVALGIMGAGLKRRESLSGRFGDILAHMYMMTAALKRFREEGERQEDAVLLKVAMEMGFNEIDRAFAGIYQNLSRGALGMIFRLKGFFLRLNPFGSEIRDKDLHAIAALLTADPATRDRLCRNIYRGGRIGELRVAAQAMQDAKQAFARRKTEGEEALEDNERQLIDRARKLQQNIIAVDSYSREEYFRC
jgi:acyl-CoA dehydrogenase